MSQHSSDSGTLESSASNTNQSTSPTEKKQIGISTLFFWVITLHLILFAIYYLAHLPQIINQYYVAAANTSLKGEGKPEIRVKNAFHWINQAIERDPDSHLLYLQRSKLKRGVEDHEGELADIEKAMELAPDDPAGIYARSEYYYQNQEFDKALKDAKQLVEMAQGEDLLVIHTIERVLQDNVVNKLNYIRALAQTELQPALTEMNELLKSGRYSSEQQAMLLDTRGLIKHHLGEYNEALTDYNRAISTYSTLYEREKELVDEKRAKILDVNLIAYETPYPALVYSLAVMYYHRGLTYQALGQESQAQVDFQLVRSLGREPDESLY